jgi:hypothetical protein
MGRSSVSSKIGGGIILVVLISTVRVRLYSLKSSGIGVPKSAGNSCIAVSTSEVRDRSSFLVFLQQAGLLHR